MASSHRRPPLRALLALSLLAPALLAGAAAAAPATPAGPTIAVSAADGYQIAPDVAALPAGAVIVWHGEVPGSGSADLQIFARRFGPFGAPLGPAVVVNGAAAGQQRRAAVAAAPDGGFVVAWDTGTSDVFARRFAADGRPLTGDLSVPVDQSSAFHRDPDVAVAADGSFVVAWQRDDDVVLRRFDADGAPLGPERYPYDRAADTAAQLNPALAALPGGAMAVVWEEAAADGSSTAIMLRRLDAGGAPVGQPEPVAASAAEQLRDPAVAASPAGALVVVWSTYADADKSGAVAARSYSAAGAPGGPAAPVSAPAAARRFLPAVAVAIDGSAAVTWGEAALPAEAPAGVAVRRLDAAGAPAGEVVYPMPLAEARQQPPLSTAAAVGAGDTSPLWVAWARVPPGGADAQSSIYAQRYVDQLNELALPLLRR